VPVVITSHFGDGLQNGGHLQHIYIVMTFMEKNCRAYEILMMIALVSICVLLFVLYHLAIVLSVLRIMASDFFFGIFKLFFIEKRVDIFNVYAINLIMLSKLKVQNHIYMVKSIGEST
jgi:hypothetical protein